MWGGILYSLPLWHFGSILGCQILRPFHCLSSVSVTPPLERGFSSPHLCFFLNPIWSWQAGSHTVSVLFYKNHCQGSSLPSFPASDPPPPLDPHWLPSWLKPGAAFRSLPFLRNNFQSLSNPIIQFDFQFVLSLLNPPPVCCLLQESPASPYARLRQQGTCSVPAKP